MRILRPFCAFGTIVVFTSVLILSTVMRAQIPASRSIENCKAPVSAEPWRDASQTPECRTLELIQKMTLDDKIRELSSTLGQPTASHFGIPALNPNDGPNGYAMGPIPGPPRPAALGVTAFPNEIELAATWDRHRAGEFGAALAEEWRAKGSSEIIAPTLNIMRTWHWGRSAETFGEDPLLTGEMAAAEVAALQRGHVIAMIKHFAANNQDWDRIGHFPEFTGINEIISQRALHEIYFPGFREAIQAGGAAGVMCAYNQINGTFACNSRSVLGELDKWGFTGAITPDAIFALHDPVQAQQAGVTFVGSEKTLRDMVSRGQLSEQAIDAMMYKVLFPIFKLGIYDQPPAGNPNAHVSTSEHQVLSRHIIEEGSVLLKNENQTLPISPERVKSIAIIGVAAGPQAVVGEQGPTVYVEKLSVPSEAIAARAGASIKVSYYGVGTGIRPLPLIDNGVLTPPSGSGHGLAVNYYRSGNLSGDPAVTRVDPGVDVNGLPAPELGPEVRSFGPPQLSWSARWSGILMPPSTGEYTFSLDGAGSAKLLVDGKTIAQFDHVNFKTVAFGVVQLTALKPVTIAVEHSNDYAVLGSALHLGWQPPNSSQMQAALDAAKSADLTVVFAGEQLGEGMDKTSLALPGDQDELIEAVSSVARRTVVVLNTSTPVAMPWLDKVGAVLEAWYPGQESGAGIASVLFGDADPGGRLPMTYPASLEQGPGTKPDQYPGVGGTVHFEEGVLVGYRWYDQHHQEPLFPFGFGLSYTRFSFSDLTLQRSENSVAVSLKIANVGSRRGSDVVQIYVELPDGAQEPPMQLRGFQKVFLDPGESKDVTIELPLQRLAAWSEDTHDWKLFPGSFRFKVGESSRSILLEKAIELGQ